MSDYEVHLLDVGTLIKINVVELGLPFPLSDATDIKIKFERKDKTTFEVDGLIFENNPLLGIIYCISDITYFTVKGAMKVQAWIESNAGSWHTAIETFTVGTNIVVTA